MSALTLESKIEELVEVEPRYAPEAYHFVFEALDYVTEDPGFRRRNSRHITVEQLLDGIRRMALEQFGPLARCVFESWGVYTTEDFGKVVFCMVEHDLLNQSEQDQREDFIEVYNFREVFEESYRPTIRLGQDVVAPQP